MAKQHDSFVAAKARANYQIELDALPQAFKSERIRSCCVIHTTQDGQFGIALHMDQGDDREAWVKMVTDLLEHVTNAD